MVKGCSLSLWPVAAGGDVVKQALFYAIGTADSKPDGIVLRYNRSDAFALVTYGTSSAAAVGTEVGVVWWRLLVFFFLCGGDVWREILRGGRVKCGVCDALAALARSTLSPLVPFLPSP
jgi:hypothetical protein